MTKLFLVLLGFLSLGLGVSQAQTVASCPTATPGTVWNATTQWLQCTSPVVYIAQPLPQSAIINDMHCVGATCTFSWNVASAVLATDQVWIETTAAPKGAWVSASTLKLASTAPPYTASATLVWTAPTTNVDGSPLTNLAGFNIYSGPSATALVKTGSVGATSLTYTTSINIGTTFFSVTAFNSLTPVGESVQSAVVSKTLAAPTATVPNPPVMSP